MKNIRGGISALFILQLVFSFLILAIVQFNQLIRNMYSDKSVVINSIKVQDGIWDISNLNDNPLPGTNGPLYILSLDGLVIERKLLIPGFLDISDFNHLMAYNTPQTITTSTSEVWKILSKPIYDKEKIIAVIATGIQNPDIIIGSDELLNNNINSIVSKITFSNNNINVSLIDKKIELVTPFLIVDTYNNVLAKSKTINAETRVPSYIDKSYVDRQILTPELSVIFDKTKHQPFLILTSALSDTNGEHVGVLVIGRALENTIAITIQYLILESSFLIILIVSRIAYNHFISSKKPKIRHAITFSARESAIFVDGVKIEILYDTNQYYMLKALFSKTEKRWETYELLELFGEESERGSRKVYDTMVGLNNKFRSSVNGKLILNKNKTYQLNSDLFK